MSATRPDGDRRRWIALGVVCMAMLMNTLDGSVVNVALPVIQRDLDIAQSDLTWVINAYLISFSSFLLLAGRLGDLVGRKRVFLSGVTLFTIASALCGIAQDQNFLIAARFLQGLGGAVSSSVIIAMIVTEFPEPAQRAKAMSAYIFVAVGGGSIGLLVGGLVTQAVNWHWIFFINIPIGVVTLVLGRALLEESEGIGLDKGVDVLGSVTVTAALMLGIYTIVSTPDYGWASPHTLLFGGAAILLLVIFFVLQARLANPIMPLRILRVPGLASSSIVRGLLAGGLFSTFFLGALYLERVRGFTALETGVAFLPLSLAVGVCSAGVTARLMTRFGARRIMLPGLVLTAVGLLLMARLGEHSTYFPAMFVPLLILGVGAGLAFIPLLAIAMANVPSADAGLASGIVNVSLQMSGALGLAVLGTISTDHARSLLADGHSEAAALTGGYQLAFLVGACCVGLGAVLAFVLLRTPPPLPASEPCTVWPSLGAGSTLTSVQERRSRCPCRPCRASGTGRIPCLIQSSPASSTRSPKDRITRGTRSWRTTARSGTSIRSRSRPTRAIWWSTPATGCSVACRSSRLPPCASSTTTRRPCRSTSPSSRSRTRPNTTGRQATAPIATARPTTTGR
jgi:EmrB/QacA subfamily drug resistance transporter